MTAASALLRRIDAPPLAFRTGICSAAIVADADALATEWSRGNDLSMVSAKDVTNRNATAIILDAAVKVLARDRVVTVTTYSGRYTQDTRVSGVVLAELIAAYVAACHAECAGDAGLIDAEADLIALAAEEIAERFRLASGGAA